MFATTKMKVRPYVTTQLILRCPSCGTANPRALQYCERCGVTQPEPGPKHVEAAKVTGFGGYLLRIGAWLRDIGDRL